MVTQEPLEIEEKTSTPEKNLKAKQSKLDGIFAMSGIMADEEEKEVVSEKLDKKESDKIEEEPKPKSQVERLFLKDEHWLCTQCGQR